jgi:cytochrome c biogenesis protein CcmG/thiol:disulfide interchange protein DsbE
MKRYLVWMPLVILVTLAAVLGKVLASGHNPNAIATPLMAAFGEDNKFITNADLKGKPLLVNFFASWCGPCAAENKLLLEMAKDHNIRIIGIAMKDSPDTLQAYLDKRGNPYARIGFDEFGSTSIDWGVSGVPETFVLDSEGKIIERHVGQLDSSEERHLIDLLKDGT